MLETEKNEHEDTQYRPTAGIDLTWLDSSHVHVNVLGHTPTPFLSVESCHLRLFPGKSHSSQVFLDHASPVCPWPAGSALETWDFPV